MPLLGRFAGDATGAGRGVAGELYAADEARGNRCPTSAVPVDNFRGRGRVLANVIE